MFTELYKSDQEMSLVIRLNRRKLFLKYVFYKIIANLKSYESPV